MNVILLGGFLGSGKTSLLLQLAPYLAKGSGKDPAVVVLENEISVTDVDTKLLRSLNLTVRNLAAGCICCTSSADLPGSVEKIRQEYAPDWLIIEATGMAYPDAIAAILEQEAGITPKVLVLADASRWKKLNIAMPAFVQGQLVRADVVLLNKVDLVGQEEKERLLSVIESRCTAPVYPVSLKEGLSPEVLSALGGIG